MRRDEEQRRRWDAFLFRVPVLGHGYRLVGNLRFARTLAILLQSGVSAIEGFSMAARATGSPWIAHLAIQEAESIRQGEKLSDAVERVPPLSDFLPAWIRTGEASGGIAALLENAASRYQYRLDRYVARSMTILPLVLILVVAAFVLLIALAVLLPVFSLSEGIKVV
jgi:general secretion pathway protein F